MKKLIILLAGVVLWGLPLHAQDGAGGQKPVKVKPTVGVHGRIQYDYEFLRQDNGIDTIENYKMSGSEFRRVDLAFSGTIYKNIKFKSMFEFAGSKVGFRDLYIKFVDLPGIGGNFLVGSIAEPTGIDMLTSSKYIPMMERAMLTHTQNFRWNSGIMYANTGLADGRMGLQLSYTHNGDNHGGFKDHNLDAGGHFVARISGSPYSNEDNHSVLHLGAKFESRKRSKEPAEYTLKFKPENHMGNKIAVPIPGLLKNQQDIGFELAGVFGPFSFQGEYEVAGYNAVKEEDRNTTTKYNVNGYYALVSYFIGGQRHYKHGAFSRPRVYSNFCVRESTWGALELVARYSAMDYSSIVEGDYYNKVSTIGIGLNWYFNDHARLMYNHVIADRNKKDDDPSKALNADMLRLAINF